MTKNFTPGISEVVKDIGTHGDFVIISLMEPIEFLRLSYFDYFEKHYDPVKSNITIYNHVPFFNSLLGDIFTKLTLDNVGYVGSDLPKAAEILIADGLERNYAVSLTLSVFQIVVDHIVTFFENPDFNGCGITHTLHGYDLVVNVTYAE